MHHNNLQNLAQERSQQNTSLSHLTKGKVTIALLDHHTAQSKPDIQGISQWHLYSRSIPKKN